MTKITAIIPTLNEEENIQRALDSVSFADEIIVIDSYSTDKTLELAKKYKVKIIQRAFDDFSSQKNYAIDKASHDWVYILDADERITPTLEKEILDTLKDSKHFVGFYVGRVFYFGKKKIRYGGYQRDKAVRLFLKKQCKYNGNYVHETITTNGELGFLKHKIDHYSYRNFNHYISKINLYSWLQAKELYKKGRKVNMFHILIKPPIRFLIHYVIRLGFLDDFEGFMIAKIQSLVVLSRYLKLCLLNKNIK